MTTRMTSSSFYAVLLFYWGVLAAGCTAGPDCNALQKSLIGTWLRADGQMLSVWSFPESFTLEANQVYRSGDVEGQWDLGYAPGNDFCDILFVGANGTIYTTYNLEMDGDYLILDLWGSSPVTYYKEGTSPPSEDD